jgi:hypothetical protein
MLRFNTFFVRDLPPKPKQHARLKRGRYEGTSEPKKPGVIRGDWRPQRMDRDDITGAMRLVASRANAKPKRDPSATLRPQDDGTGGDGLGMTMLAREQVVG